MVTTTGVPEVARITDGDPVAVALPTPRAVPAAGGVDLEWTVRLDDVDGFHVFRRLPGSAATRVTETLLPADGAVIRYRDDAPPPAGGTAWYSYAAWRDGRELARGLVAFDSADAARILGCNSTGIADILGYGGRTEMIHRDDLVLATKFEGE